MNETDKSLTTYLNLFLSNHSVAYNRNKHISLYVGSYHEHTLTYIPSKLGNYEYDIEYKSNGVNK